MMTMMNFFLETLFQKINYPNLHQTKVKNIKFLHYLRLNIRINQHHLILQLKIRKNTKKNTKKSSSKAESTFDESTTLTRSLSYNNLPLTKMNQQLNKDDDFSQDSDSQNVHKLSEKYNSHIIADKKKGKKSVKFTTNEQIEEDDSMKSLSNNKKRSNKNIHNKKGIKDQTTHSIKSASSH